MSEEKKSEAAPPPLVKDIDRKQMWFRTVEVDRLVDADHPARLLWETIGSLDLSGYYEGIKSNELRSISRLIKKSLKNILDTMQVRRYYSQPLEVLPGTKRRVSVVIHADFR